VQDLTPNILILGASGLIGRRLLERLGPSGSVGTYHRNKLPGCIRFDAVADRISQLGDSLGAIRHAVILFGVTRIDACARDPAGTGALNVAATCSVIDALAARGITPVFASSDVVFDGKRGGYREEDAPAPILTYGRQKLEVEDYLRARTPAHLILRLPKIVAERPGAGGLFDDWLQAVRSGELVHCASDQFFSPIGLDDAISAVIALMSAGAVGTYHVGGPKTWDRASLFEALAGALRQYREVDIRMRRCSIRDFPQFAESRPLDVSLNSEKLCRQIGFTARDMTEVCAAFAEAALGCAPAATRKI
jgi:dTDP-4-dehydrorhamnose reductase